MKKSLAKIAVAALLIVSIFSFTGCNETKPDNGVSSQIKSSIEEISSVVPSSDEASSEEPVSSKTPVSSKETVSSKPVSSSTTSSEQAVSSETEDERIAREEQENMEFQKSIEERPKENGLPTNGYVRFNVTDINGSPIAGIVTSYGTNFVPSTMDSVFFFSHPRDAAFWITDSEGNAIINLVKQDLGHKIGSVNLTWNKQFKATITSANDNSWTAQAKDNTIGGYRADFGATVGEKSLEIDINDNETTVIEVGIEEITE